MIPAYTYSFLNLKQGILALFFLFAFLPGEIAEFFIPENVLELIQFNDEAEKSSKENTEFEKENKEEAETHFLWSSWYLDASRQRLISTLYDMSYFVGGHVRDIPVPPPQDCFFSNIYH